MDKVKLGSSMKTKFTITFLLLFPIVNMFYSCVCDVTTKYESYSHKSLLLKSLDNSGAQIVETDNLQINKNAYGIRLYLTREKNVIAHVKQINSIFTQSAYALSYDCPPEFFYSPSDSIVSIKIVTINNFDKKNSENSDITDYFKIAHSHSTVNNFVANMGFSYGIDGEFEDFAGKEIKIDLLLMTAPTVNNHHRFKIQVELSDKRILEQLTAEIELI